MRRCRIRSQMLVLVLLVLVCSLAQAQTVVTIDVKPGSDVNPVNVHAHGVIPVAILCTLDPTDPTLVTFDPSTVDASSLLFGTPGESPAIPCTLEDVNTDGCPDLMCHFSTQGSGIACGDTEVALTGLIADGTAISGSDTIVTVGCQGKGSK